MYICLLKLFYHHFNHHEVSYYHHVLGPSPRHRLPLEQGSSGRGSCRERARALLDQQGTVQDLAETAGSHRTSGREFLEPRNIAIYYII